MGAVGFTFYDHQGYPDIFFVIPYLAISTGAMVIWIEVRAEWPTSRWTRVFRWAVVVALVLIASTGARRIERRVHLEDQLRLAGEIGSLSQDLDGIYAVNCTHLLALNRMSNWNEYGHFFRGVRALMLERTSGADRPPWRDGKLPDLIVVSGWMPPEIRSVVQADFVRVKNRRFGRQNVAVWRRNESLSPAPRR